MVQLDHYTMAVDPFVSGFDERDRFGNNSTRNPLVQSLDQALRLGLEQGEESRTMGEIDTGDEVATWSTFTGHQQQNDGLDSVLGSPAPNLWPERTFHALQEWEGYVVEIRDKDFVARLLDLTFGSESEEEEADIPLAEISSEDSAKICPGSVFRWVIGYERSAAGTKRRVSEIVFRDAPEITETDLKDGEAWAQEAIRSLNL